LQKNFMLDTWAETCYNLKLLFSDLYRGVERSHTSFQPGFF
jgi:hypothetical protein